jgi:hypothetical protein
MRFLGINPDRQRLGGNTAGFQSADLGQASPGQGTCNLWLENKGPNDPSTMSSCTFRVWSDGFGFHFCTAVLHGGKYAGELPVGGWGQNSEGKILFGRRESPKMPQNPHRPLKTVLGTFYFDSIADGLNPLTISQTARAIS